jgi:hypothetical protein
MSWSPSFDTAIGYTKTAHGYGPIRNSNDNIYAHFAYPHEFLAHCRWQGHWNRKYIDFEEYIIDPRRLSDDNVVVVTPNEATGFPIEA